MKLRAIYEGEEVTIIEFFIDAINTFALYIDHNKKLGCSKITSFRNVEILN